MGLTKRVIKNIKLNECIKCGSNDWNLIFPDNKVKAKCVECNFKRQLTHTEVNVNCWKWA